MTARSALYPHYPVHAIPVKRSVGRSVRFRFGVFGVDEEEECGHLMWWLGEKKRNAHVKIPATKYQPKSRDVTGPRVVAEIRSRLTPIQILNQTITGYPAITRGSVPQGSWNRPFHSFIPRYHFPNRLPVQAT